MSDTITHNHYGAPPDDDDVTEMEKMFVDEVHAVGSPANGTPWLLMKGADDTELTGPEALAAIQQAQKQGRSLRVEVKDEDLPWLATQLKAAGSELTKSESGEADAILELVTGENSGHGSPRHPITGKYLPNTVEGHAMNNLASAQKSLDDLLAREGLVTQPELDSARQRLAQATLAAVHTPRERAAKSTAMTPLQKAVATNIARLRAHYDGLPNGDDRGTDQQRQQAVEKRHAGLQLTRVQLASKAIFDDQQEATNAAVRAAQAKASKPASLGGGDPQEQVRRIGSGTGVPESLGAPTGANRGDLTGKQGQVEPEPVAQLQHLENELQAAGAPLEKEHLRDQLNVQRLKMSRMGYVFKAGNGGDAQPELVGHVDASNVNAIPNGGQVNADYLAKARKKANKRAIKRAVRKAMA